MTANPTLLAGFRAALDAETSLEAPLTAADPHSIDDFLDRINEDLAAGMPQKITPERLKTMVNLFRVQAANWEMEQQKEKTSSRGSGKKASLVEIEGFNTGGLNF